MHRKTSKCIQKQPIASKTVIAPGKQYHHKHPNSSRNIQIHPDSSKFIHSALLLGQKSHHIHPQCRSMSYTRYHDDYALMRSTCLDTIAVSLRGSVRDGLVSEDYGLKICIHLAAIASIL